MQRDNRSLSSQQIQVTRVLRSRSRASPVLLWSRCIRPVPLVLALRPDQGDPAEGRTGGRFRELQCHNSGRRLRDPSLLQMLHYICLLLLPQPYGYASCEIFHSQHDTERPDWAFWPWRNNKPSHGRWEGIWTRVVCVCVTYRYSIRSLEARYSHRSLCKQMNIHLWSVRRAPPGAGIMPLRLFFAGTNIWR